MKKWNSSSILISIFALALSLNSVSCTHLNSISTSSVPAKRTKPVSAEGSRFMFMLFNFDNKYADNMVMDLAQQCPQGRVEGILTKFETTTYFPLIFYKLRASAEGYCVTRN